MSDAAVQQGDPFAFIASGSSRATPLQALQDLIAQEGELDFTCELKDRDWANPTCIGCPERGTAGRDELCRIGMAQETYVTRKRLGTSSNVD